MAELTELDYRIIEAAKLQFLSVGINNTDMKQLASDLNISRSTLYRHFGSSLQIAFHVIKSYIVFLVSDDESLYADINGYDSFSLYIHRLVGRFCNHLDMMRVIQEFDTLYSFEKSTVDPPQDYSVYMSSDQNLLLVELFQKGIKDGSIHFRKDPIIAANAFLHTAFGLVERIMLREQTYLKEHGVAREYIDYAIDMMLSSIRA